MTLERAERLANWFTVGLFLGAALILLVGCGGSSDETNNHGYGYGYDVESANGLRLRYTPTLETSHYYADIAFYDSEFERVQACTGITAPAPFVIVVKPDQLPGYSGYYRSNPPLIIVVDFVVLAVFHHEAIHYLLDYSTGNLDKDHASPLFRLC